MVNFMAKFCANCGTKLDDNQMFCHHCGKPVEPQTMENHASQPNGNPAKQSNPQSLAKKAVTQSGAANQDIWETIRRDYLRPEGRLNRKAYIIRQCIVSVASMIPYMLLEMELEILAGVFFLLLGIAGLMLNIKRCHDLDKTGWFVLLLAVPLLNAVVLLYLLFARGTYGDNAYGPDPLQ